jgi:nitrogen fixation protein FixH
MRQRRPAPIAGNKATEFAVANSADYVVTKYEIEPGKWQGEIRRGDGKEMQVEGTRKAVFTTRSHNRRVKRRCWAYQALDTNRISPVGST